MLYIVFPAVMLVTAVATRNLMGLVAFGVAWVWVKAKGARK